MKGKVSFRSQWWRTLPGWILIAARVRKTTIITQMPAALLITKKDLVSSFLWEQQSIIILLRAGPKKEILVKTSADPKMSQQVDLFKLSRDHPLKLTIAGTTSLDVTHKRSRRGMRKTNIKMKTQITNTLLLSTTTSKYRSTKDKIKEVEINTKKFQNLQTKSIKRNPPITKT